MTLEELIQRAAKRGELTHLSVCFVGGSFHASMTSARAGSGHAFMVGPDPVEVLKQVLNTKPVKPTPFDAGVGTVTVIPDREPPKDHVCANPAGGERCNICFAPLSNS